MKLISSTIEFFCCWSLPVLHTYAESKYLLQPRVVAGWGEWCHLVMGLVAEMVVSET
jgi:hypothetical protein